MKRLIGIIVILAVLLSIYACSSKKTTTNMGVNAEILELNNHVKGMVVKALDEKSILSEKTYINCENEQMNFVEVVDGEPVKITFKDLSVGDKITVDIKKVEDKYAPTSRVQLIERAK